MSASRKVAADNPPGPTDDFEALCGNVLQGRRLPSVADLIRGCPFYKDDLAADARAFAKTLRRNISAPDGGELLQFALTEMTVEPDVEKFLVAASAFEASEGKSFGRFRLTDAAAARCHF